MRPMWAAAGRPAATFLQPAVSQPGAGAAAAHRTGTAGMWLPLAGLLLLLGVAAGRDCSEAELLAGQAEFHNCSLALQYRHEEETQYGAAQAGSSAQVSALPRLCRPHTECDWRTVQINSL